jgi:hypothetical protein
LKSSIHVIWFLVACSDSIADILIATYFFKVKKRFGLYMAWFMVGVSIEASMAAFSLIALWPREVEVATVFAAWRTTGRTIKMIGAWTFLAYLFYFVNGDLKVDSTRTPD